MKIFDVSKPSTTKRSFDRVFEEGKCVYRGPSLRDTEREVLRRQHQVKLVQQKNKKTARRLSSAGDIESNLKTLNDELIGCNSRDDKDKFKPIRLSCLYIHPFFSGSTGKMTGALVAHANGFRYSTSTEYEMVDIMYANIKHAFFQKARVGVWDGDGGSIALLHLHLHNHMMVGNTKTKDVQFYMEEDIYEAQACGDKTRFFKSGYRIEEEINMVFREFVDRVHDLWLVQPECKALGLEFEQLKGGNFFGGAVVPCHDSCIVPTSSCLVDLKWSPFLIITLSEIEIVNLERIRVGQKDFDMAIVFKDFKRDVMRIASISFYSLGGIKKWLDSNGLVYFESRVNLNWGVIMKTFLDDPQAFIDLGGWEFMNREKDVFYEDSGSICLDLEATDTYSYLWDHSDSSSEEDTLGEGFERDARNSNTCNKGRRRRTKMRVFGTHKMIGSHFKRCREKQAPTTLTERKEMNPTTRKVTKRKEMSPTAARKERKNEKKKMKAASSGKRRAGPGTSTPKRSKFN